MQLQVAPSILSADFSNLGKDIRMLNGCADLIHLDVMDGSFVPNISFGFPVIESVSKVATIPMDAHLMVVNPWKWFARLHELGVSMVSFHYETATRRSGKCLQEIKDLGMKAGLVINPDVPVEKLFPYIGKADFFVIMSVFAGFGGQKFIYESIDRIEKLKKELSRRNSDALIEVDGGIDLSNASSVRDAGADILVAGSSVFRSDDPSATVSALKL